MSKSYLMKCPRCGTRSYEQLATHGYCIECLYSADCTVAEKKRDFLTLREAEALIEPTEVHQMKRDQKKVSGAAS